MDGRTELGLAGQVMEGVGRGAGVMGPGCHGAEGLTGPVKALSTKVFVSPPADERGYRLDVAYFGLVAVPSSLKTLSSVGVVRKR